MPVFDAITAAIEKFKLKTGHDPAYICVGCDVLDLLHEEINGITSFVVDGDGFSYLGVPLYTSGMLEPKQVAVRGLCDYKGYPLIQEVTSV